MNTTLFFILILTQFASLWAMNEGDNKQILNSIRTGNWKELGTFIRENKIEFSSNNQFLKKCIAEADTSGHWQVAQLLATHILVQSVPTSDKPLFYIKCKIDDGNAEWITGICERNIHILRALLPKPTYSSRNIAGATDEDFNKEFNRQYRGLAKALSKNDLRLRYALVKLFTADETPRFCFYKFVGITQKDIDQYNEQVRFSIQKQIQEVK